VAFSSVKWKLERNLYKREEGREKGFSVRCNRIEAGGGFLFFIFLSTYIIERKEKKRKEKLTYGTKKARWRGCLFQYMEENMWIKGK
jgi:hypothetical protein